MLAKPSKAAAVENLLIQMARMGQLRGKIGEDELIGLLEKVSGGSGEKMRVNVSGVLSNRVTVRLLINFFM